jgi:hypothetical protein
MGMIGHQDPVSAFKNAAVMVAFHGMGYQKGLIDPKAQILQGEDYKMATAKINSLTNDVLGDFVQPIKKGGAVPVKTEYPLDKVEEARQKFVAEHPNDTHLPQTPIKTQADATDFFTRVALNKFGDIVNNARANGNELSTSEIEAEIRAIGTAGNRLYNQTLEPGSPQYGTSAYDTGISRSERQQKEMQDLLSLGESMRGKINPNKLRGNPQNILQNVALKMPTSGTMTPAGIDVSQLPSGNIQLSGNSTEINQNASNNIKLYDTKGKELKSDQVFLALDPKDATMSRIVNYYAGTGGVDITDEAAARKIPESQAEKLAAKGKIKVKIPKKLPIAYPDDTIHAYYVVDGPNGREIREAGFAPTPERIAAGQYSQDTNFSLMAKRVKNLFSRATTGQNLIDLYKNDLAKPNLTLAEADNLISRKADIMKLKDEDFVSAIKATRAQGGNALEKFQNTGLNNSTIAKAMRDQGITLPRVGILCASPLHLKAGHAD